MWLLNDFLKIEERDPTPGEAETCAGLGPSWKPGQKLQEVTGSEIFSRITPVKQRPVGFTLGF